MTSQLRGVRTGSKRTQHICIGCEDSETLIGRIMFVVLRRTSVWARPSSNIDIMGMNLRNSDTTTCINQVSVPDKPTPLVAVVASCDKNVLLKTSSTPDLHEVKK